MRLKCTRGVASSVSRLLLCHVPTARPSRTSWSEASLPMWRHPTGARSADSASTAAATTSESGIGAPVPNAKARWNPQARKNSGRKSRHNLKIPPHAARGFLSRKGMQSFSISPHNKDCKSDKKKKIKEKAAGLSSNGLQFSQFVLLRITQQLQLCQQQLCQQQRCR